MLFRRKTAKITAYETLIKYNISSLPVPTTYSDGIRIYTMQFLAGYFKEDVSKYFNTFGYRGFVCYEPEFDNYAIFINRDDPDQLQRWSISIALGFIESRKFKENRSFSLSDPTDYAEDFTYVYTCPDCILKRDGITSTEDIIKICQVPFNKAREKNKRLKLSSNSRNDKLKTVESVINDLIKKTRI